MSLGKALLEVILYFHQLKTFVMLSLSTMGRYYIVCGLQFVAKYQVVNQVYLNNTEEGGWYCIWTQSAIVSFLTLLTKGEWEGREGGIKIVVRSIQFLYLTYPIQ